jgi:hypothetical protein
MNPTFCPHEEHVSRSARTGCWDDSTKAHLMECAHCRDIAQVSEWLGNMARTGEKECVLPDPGQVWMNARALAMQAARKRALRPLAIAEAVVRVALTLALAAGVAWVWSGFQSLTADLLPWHSQVLRPLFLSLTSLATCCVILLFIQWVGPVLVEE